VSPRRLYISHADHLNTPRLVANAQGQTVWRWDQQEPFGVNAPDENPSGLGTFEFTLRFPGQYFDRETNLHYNYFRDYDPSLGRYEQSDPIGLRGGLNTYAYVGGNPLTRTDSFGQDYWIEGSVEGEGGYPFHRSVCVGKYSGPRMCISFGISENTGCLFACKGEVYIDDSAAGPIVRKTYYQTSPEADRQIAATFNSVLGKEGSYWLIGNSCRDFSQAVWNHLFLNYRGSPGTAR
jgi:RHS repeat-associated protein